MCDYSRKPVKWQVGNFSYLLISPAVVALSTVGGVPPPDPTSSHVAPLTE